MCMHAYMYVMTYFRYTENTEGDVITTLATAQTEHLLIWRSHFALII